MLKKAWLYCERVDKKHWKDLLDNQRLSFGTEKDEAGVFHSDTFGTVVAVDGSSKGIEWLGNFKFKNVKGFHGDMYRAGEALYDLVKDLKIDYLIGYSRGAGIIQCLADIIYQKTGKCPKIISFGAPKVSKVERDWSCYHTTVKSILDLVTMVVPTWSVSAGNVVNIKSVGHTSYKSYFK